MQWQFQIWIHHSELCCYWFSDFQCSVCVIGSTSVFISFPFLRDGFLTTHLPVRVCDEASAHKGSDFILNVIFSPVTSLSYPVPSNCFKHSMLKVPTFWLIAFWESPHWCRNTIFMMSNCNVCVCFTNSTKEILFYFVYKMCICCLYDISHRS